MNPLTMKLEQFTSLAEDERKWLDEFCSSSRRTFEPGQPIFERGQRATEVVVVLDGLAIRRKSLRDGRQQLLAFLIPGDLCDVEVFVLEAMDHDIVAVGETVCAFVPAKVMEAQLHRSCNLTRALWWSTMLDSAILREWLVGHGSRDARARVAHLFFELLIRHRLVGRAQGDSFALPLPQEALAEAVGMTAVHLNRTLQELRADGLIRFEKKALTVLDPAGLKAAASFESDYLHLKRTEGRNQAASHRTGDLVSSSPI